LPELGLNLTLKGSRIASTSEAEAYAAGLTPDQDYQVLLFKDANGRSTPIGRTAAFYVIRAPPQ
jgi:hypothetical protein